LKKLISVLTMLLLVILFIAAICSDETEGSIHYGSSTNRTSATIRFEKAEQSEDLISGYIKNIIPMSENMAAVDINVPNETPVNAASDNVEPVDDVGDKKSEINDGKFDHDKKDDKDQNKNQEVTNENAPVSGEPSQNKRDDNIRDKSSKSNKPMVALTFDDGPHPQYTLEILDALNKYKGHATFFVVGNRAEKYKSVIKKINENGNQIGNHSYDHKQLTKLSMSDMENELNKTSDILNSIIDKRPDIIRPTYGSVNDLVKSTAGAPLILWSVDTLDWKTKNKNLIVNKVAGKVKDGDIILMHDLYKTSAQAAEVIIQSLSAKGFQLVTIDELFAARGTKLSNGMVYAEAYKKR
jgi:peptidoglycan/xylan/chitin deacetylase (PgdA/CDA1 family)